MGDYIRTELLGQGTYGKVYKATHIKTGQIVAIKRAILPEDQEGVPPTTLREVSLLRSLQSPYIVRLEKIMFTQGVEGEPILELAFEFLDSDLQNFMLSRYGMGVGMDQNLAKRFCYHMLMGLKECHTIGIMHRDLKPQNLLIDEKSMTLKVGDFGLGRAFSLPCRRYTHEVVTLWYRGPEILLGSSTYSPALDVWSVGCILSEMAVGVPIFKGATQLEQLLSIFKVLGTPTIETWPGVSSLRDWHAFPEWSPQSLTSAAPGLESSLGPAGVKMLEQMLQMDPDKRITVLDALKSPYFDSVREKEIKPST